MVSIRIPDANPALQPRITVIGVGGAGGNAVNNMIRSNLEGVEFLVCNTDAQALNHSAADRRIQLGLSITRGLGAGSRPEVGRASAEEAMEELFGYLEGSNMVFITAGMGGGTGTGAAPVIARVAREHNILTVGVVTKPFQFEGAHRMRTAEAGIQELQQFVDTLIVIPNQNLFRIANEKTTFADAFKMADEVLHSGVRGVTDLMVMPGLINLDFADIRTVMSEMGKAMMGTGEAEGPRRAIDAAEAAISNPLLDEVSLKGARAMLINITAGMDIALFEVDEAVNRVRSEVDPDANVIFGSTFDPSMEGRLRVSVVATGIDAQSAVQPIQPRQPTLDLIRGGHDGVTPIRKGPLGGFGGINAGGMGGVAVAVAAGQSWPSATAGLGAQPISMGATAVQLDPHTMEMGSEPEPEAVPPAVEARQAEAAPGQSWTQPAQTPGGAESDLPIGLRAPPRISEPLQQYQAPTPTPAPQAPERKRSLFERMTGVGRRAESASAPQTPPQPRRAEPTLGGGSAPRVHQQQDPGTLSAAQPGLGIEQPVRTRQASLDPKDIEIPAFLRRQAN